MQIHSVGCAVALACLPRTLGAALANDTQG